jgi:regulatory protein
MDAKEAVNATDIRRAAMDLLARREHSKRELQQKLALRFSNRDLIDSELERLCREHLQSDARYTEVYLHSRAQRLYGPSRIKAELRERGITDEIIAVAFAAVDIDWSANLRKLESNKFGTKPPADLREKAKRIRFLQYRGFGGVAVSDTFENSDS